MHTVGTGPPCRFIGSSYARSTLVALPRRAARLSHPPHHHSCPQHLQPMSPMARVAAVSPLLTLTEFTRSRTSCPPWTTISAKAAPCARPLLQCTGRMTCTTTAIHSTRRCRSPSSAFPHSLVQPKSSLSHAPRFRPSTPAPLTHGDYHPRAECSRCSVLNAQRATIFACIRRNKRSARTQ
jgi:hypothetical protein